MSSFTAPLDIRYDATASKALGRDHWRVTRGFVYYLGDLGSQRWVAVPAGFLTDGASVPRAFWSLIPPWGAYGQAAALHDYLCEYLSITVDGRPQNITRDVCDSILDEAMGVLGVEPALRKTIYDAVCAYRWVSGVSKPSSTALKRSLEAAWRDDPPASIPTLGVPV